MTTDAQLAPTDDEIHAVVQACRERGLREFDVFRTVLAKLGTQPQPGAVGRTGCTAGTDEECTRRGCATSCPAQQAAPKAAPVEQDDHQILAITTAYEQGVGKGHQAYNSGKEIANPYSPAYRCDLAWQYGYKEGKEQAQREAKAAPQQEAQEPVAWLNPWRADQVTTDYDAYGEHGIALYTAPQPAPAPLSDAVEHYLEAQDALDNREYSGINAEPYEKLLRRRNASRNDLDAALAAQGGKV